MTGPEIRGWCPGALRPMLSGDGWVVRVRPPCGRLSPAQAAGVAQLAIRHGNGWLDLSSRANLQIRGVSAPGHAPLTQGLRDLGLVDDDAAHEGRRNIMVTPFWRVGDGVQTVVLGLTAALAAPGAPDLPGKFGFAVDTGICPVLQHSPADIRIEAVPAGLIVRADGFATGAQAEPATTAGLAMELAQWFLATGGAVAGRGRMARHLAHLSVPERHDRLPPHFRTPVVQQTQANRQATGQAGDATVGAHAAGFMVAIALGQMRAETLTLLAGMGGLRLTPWRMILVEGLQDAPTLPGLITDPCDPMLRVIACTGRPGCLQAHQPTRDLARALAPKVPKGMTLHVSGCAKGCAHPAPADITLVAAPDGFGLIRNGVASDQPAIRNLSVAAIADSLKATHAP